MRFATKIVVTGGTGFVGCHTVSELFNSNHELLLIVRSKNRVESALAPLGVNLSQINIVEGDVTDRAVVRYALDGMDAVVHAASVYTLDKRRSAEILRTNKRGAEIVLEESCRADIDPILHVSSVAAILSPVKGSVITSESPPTPMNVGTYVDSKKEQEIVARHYQKMGAPVIIIYPGAVMGPHDPNWGDGPILVESVLRNKTWFSVDGRFPVVDVRDLARFQATLIEPGKGPRRFLFSGTLVTHSEIVNLLSFITGRKIRCIPLPMWFVHPIIKIMESFCEVLPLRLPVTSEGLSFLKSDLEFANCDSIAGKEIERLELRTTMEDMLRWMHATGRIPDEWVGKLYH